MGSMGVSDYMASASFLWATLHIICEGDKLLCNIILSAGRYVQEIRVVGTVWCW